MGQGSLDSLFVYAPDAHAALGRAWDAAQAEVDPGLFAVGRQRVEGQLGLTEGPGQVPEDELGAAAAALADQFVFYAPQIDESLLAPLRDRIGEEALRTFVDALYVLDQTTRLRLESRLLLDGASDGEREPEPAAPVPPLAEAIRELHAAAMRLDGLDPITTEIVRLRAADYHDCKT
jgi:hypothetical protein